MGLFLWVVAVPLLGDPRISYVVAPLDGAGTPVLVARAHFQVAAEAPVETLAQAPRPGTTPSTRAQLEIVQPVLWAMALPEVRKALGTLDEPVAVVPSLVVESMLSYPEQMVPGSPAASVAQVMNPTKNLLLAELRPTIVAGQDERLCSALQVVIVSVEPGKAPKMMLGGKVMDMVKGRTTPIVLEAGHRYNLAILVSVPQDAGNEYQGVSCTVDFLMQAQNI